MRSISNFFLVSFFCYTTTIFAMDMIKDPEFLSILLEDFEQIEPSEDLFKEIVNEINDHSEAKEIIISENNSHIIEVEGSDSLMVGSPSSTNKEDKKSTRKRKQNDNIVYEKSDEISSETDFWYCDICRIEFTQKSSLNRHIRDAKTHKNNVKKKSKKK